MCLLVRASSRMSVQWQVFLALLFTAAAANALAAAPAARGRAGAALGVPTDITKEGDVTRLVERVTGSYSSVDVVVNCAGILGYPCIGQDDLWHAFYKKPVPTGDALRRGVPQHYVSTREPFVRC